MLHKGDMLEVVKEFEHNYLASFEGNTFIIKKSWVAIV